MTPAPPLKDLAAAWQDARLLYPLYVALSREFVIEVTPCSELETGDDAPPQETVEKAQQWLAEVDERIQVHQLRQFLQTTTLASDEALRTLLVHHLRRESHSDSDRDKIDFLLVQFFSHCAPSRVEDSDVDLAYVGQVLEPVLGTVEASAPEWLSALDEIVHGANHCRSLKELFASKVLEKGRTLKTTCGQKYFEPAAMVAFTRFSFLMRRVFFRLMHQDLNAILDGLRELELLEVHTLDCRRAQFSADEPIARLRMICQSWKVMFHAEYSSGQPLGMLVDLRAVIENALAKSKRKTESAAPAAARAHAAATGGSAVTSDVPEFEVGDSSQDWSEHPSATAPGAADDDGNA